MIFPKNRACQDSVGSHYDDLDAFYRKIWGTQLHHGIWITGLESIPDATTRLVELVAHRAQVGEGTKICDVGCGYGEPARYLASRYRAQVTGFTVSQKQLEFAHATSTDPKNPTFILRDWLKNDIRSESHDAVIAIESSEHMSDLGRFYEEAARVLKPGGRLVVCAWLYRPEAEQWQRKHLLEPICDEGRLSLASRDEHVTRLEGAGFRLNDFEDLSIQVQPTWSKAVKGFLKEVMVEPAFRSFLRNKLQENRVFAKSLFRLWLAYTTGAMQYGLIAAKKQ